ncbi:MAG: Rho termination factor N-terminal domain-containing protein [Candidatus Thorarchaeota archaeon]
MVDERVGILCGSAKDLKDVWEENLLSTEKVLEYLYDKYNISMSSIALDIKKSTDYIYKNLDKFRRSREDMAKVINRYILKQTKMKNLINFAKAYNIKGYSGKNKDQIIDIILMKMKK